MSAKALFWLLGTIPVWCTLQALGGYIHPSISGYVFALCFVGYGMFAGKRL